MNGEANPKTLMGRRKVPNLSVIPAASIVIMGAAMRYGAYEAPRLDGGKGYGPFNWREVPIEAGVYIDAAVRHLMQWYDGEEIAADSGVSHLGHAMGAIGILIDAIENNTWIDTRPTQVSQAATRLLEEMKTQ